MAPASEESPSAGFDFVSHFGIIFAVAVAFVPASNQTAASRSRPVIHNLLSRQVDVSSKRISRPVDSGWGKVGEMLNERLLSFHFIFFWQDKDPCEK